MDLRFLNLKKVMNKCIFISQSILTYYSLSKLFVISSWEYLHHTSKGIKSQASTSKKESTRTQGGVKHNCGQTKGEQKIQRPGIEPGTSAVLRPRHNQLDHLCVMISHGELCYMSRHKLQMKNPLHHGMITRYRPPWMPSRSHG